MYISYEALRSQWHANHSYVLHYINSWSDYAFTSEHLWNALMQQAMHIVCSSENEYWYLAANYDLLSDDIKGFVDCKTRIARSFITFEALRSIIQRSEGFYVPTEVPPEFEMDIEIVMNTLLTNYNAQVTMLRKTERYV